MAGHQRDGVARDRHLHHQLLDVVIREARDADVAVAEPSVDAIVQEVAGGSPGSKVSLCSVAIACHAVRHHNHG